MLLNACISLLISYYSTELPLKHKDTRSLLPNNRQWISFFVYLYCLVGIRSNTKRWKYLIKCMVGQLKYLMINSIDLLQPLRPKIGAIHIWLSVDLHHDVQYIVPWADLPGIFFFLFFALYLFLGFFRMNFKRVCLRSHRWCAWRIFWKLTCLCTFYR